MNDIICLDNNYSTTKLLIKEKPKILHIPEDKFETILFLPEGEGRKGEGGLRTKGYFKKSYEDKPLISIVTVVFNGEKYLEETIQSVLNQTYDNVEYIIIDGGSTDGTVDILKRYDDKIDYWVSEKDSGIYDAMNKGIDVATGQWINFINIGDLLIHIPRKILCNLNNDLVAGRVILESISTRKTFKPSFNYKIKLCNTIHHQGVFYRTKKLGFFSLEYKVFSDFAKNQELYKKQYKISITDNIIASHSSDGVSHSEVNFKENFEIVKNNYGIYTVVLSYFCYKIRGVKSALYNFSRFI
jgi:glycosyltransferase involved in cell wall biosynthesis